MTPATYVVGEEARPAWRQTYPGPEHGLDVGFDIDVRFIDGSLTAQQQSVIASAAESWQRVVVGDLPDFYTQVPLAGQFNVTSLNEAGLFVDDLFLDVLATTIDGIPSGAENILASGARSWSRI